MNYIYSIKGEVFKSSTRTQVTAFIDMHSDIIIELPSRIILKNRFISKDAALFLLQYSSKNLSIVKDISEISSSEARLLLDQIYIRFDFRRFKR